jgi:ornithine cyclodeaminase
MAEAIEGMKAAYMALSQGRAVMPLRGRVPAAEEGVTLLMPAYLPASGPASGGSLGIKIVSVFPHNGRRGLPLIHALVLALDPATGQPLAIIEGSTLTAIRTGAGAGAATDILARPDAEVVAIFGSGVQARTQLEAVCTVRPIREVRVYSPTPEHAAAFAQAMVGQGPVPNQIQVVDSPAAAVRDADVICAATTSHTPVFDGRELKPGAHVNGVGSFTPQMQEIDRETVRRSLVVVDSREAALEEAGDLIVPLNEGGITLDHIHAELGEIIAGQKPGRTSAEQITFFKSVGVAVQDAAAARIVLQNGRAHNLGVELP